MTTHSSKSYKLRNIHYILEGQRGMPPSNKGKLTISINQSHRVYHQFWRKQNR